MKKTRLTLGLLLALLLGSRAVMADFVLSFNSADFGIVSTFNTISFFDFEITIAEPLVAGGAYLDPVLSSVNYVIHGALPNSTPSGFDNFALTRGIAGDDFYDLSPDASISFTIAAGADLSDGLQLSELSGATTIFSFNARELDQQPGRYHPPIFSLDADGTGRLVNADNQSIFANPPRPLGSGLLVDVAVGDEYDVALTFNPNLTVAAPVPLPPALLLLGVPAIAVLPTRRKPARSRIAGLEP